MDTADCMMMKYILMNAKYDFGTIKIEMTGFFWYQEKNFTLSLASLGWPTAKKQDQIQGYVICFASHKWAGPFHNFSARTVLGTIAFYCSTIRDSGGGK